MIKKYIFVIFKMGLDCFLIFREINLEQARYVKLVIEKVVALLMRNDSVSHTSVPSIDLYLFGVKVATNTTFMFVDSLRQLYFP